MTDWSLRLARAGDAESFHAVEEDAATLLHEEPSLQGIPVPPSTSPADYCKLIARGHCLTAHADDEVIGFAAAGPLKRELHLNEISVRRAFQGKGIGAALLEALAIDAHNSGFRAITLNTYRDIPWNGPFYARHGFVEVENFEGRPHLAESLEGAVALGMPRERRCAMIRYLP